MTATVPDSPASAGARWPLRSPRTPTARLGATCARCALFVLCGTLAPCAVAAMEPSLARAWTGAAGDANLADERTWWRLVHAGPRAGGTGAEPAVISAGFYLSDSDPFSPRAELDATLAAFARAARAQAVTSDPPTTARSRADTAAHADADPRCRYRARWLWLARSLPATVGAEPAPRCPAFDAWAKLDAVKSLSLMHVSGHFGNPASAFGHLLLRADTDASSGVRGLRDLGVNFGARVPEGDSSLVYVLKGLFGGYEAGFVEQSFHLHDAVYSATEQRDMWAYELDLDPERREFLLAHLWELREARFGYYFLKYNCARYLSLLLELVLDEPFTPNIQPWHLPQSVFERLAALETESGRPLVREVRFVPSLERESNARFAALGPAEARLANAAIGADVAADALSRAGSATLDFLLAWIDYREARARPQERDAWRARKRRVLAERLRRPPVAAPFVVPPLAPPAAGPSARTARLGIERVDGASRTVLGIAPYAYDLPNANRGGLVDADFKVLEISIALDADEVTLRRVDLLAVEKLAPPAASIAGESRLLWRGALSLVGDDPGCVNCSDVVIGGGFGRGRGFGSGRGASDRPLVDAGIDGGAGSRIGAGGAPGEGIAYAYLDASLGSTRSLIGPALGVLYRPLRNLAARAEIGLSRTSEGGDIARVRGELFVGLGRQGNVALTMTRVDDRESFALGASLRW